MSKSRSIVLLGSLGLAVLLLLSWFLLLSPRLSKASALNTQRDTLIQQNTLAQHTIDELEQKKTNIAAAQADAALLSKKFPATAAESDLFRLVKAAAAEAGIPEKNISDLTAGVPALGAANGSVTLPQTPAPAAAGTKSTDPNAAPAAPTTPAAAPVGQLGTMTMDVTVAGTQPQIVQFLSALENMDRAYLVQSVAIGKTDGGNGSSATITGQMFLLPALVDPTAGKPAPAPAPVTPTPGATAPATPAPPAS